MIIDHSPHVAVPRPLLISKPGEERRDSESQLQSLVARVQCGDWPPVITSLLRDRLKAASEAKEAGTGAESEAELYPRSIYRETLFLNMIVSSGRLDIGMPSPSPCPRPSALATSPSPSHVYACTYCVDKYGTLYQFYMQSSPSLVYPSPSLPDFVVWLLDPLPVVPMSKI